MKIDINQVKENPSNPRTITEEMFEKLKQSLIDTPSMKEARPIVVAKGILTVSSDEDGNDTSTFKKTDDFYVLGGNMRLKAERAIGSKEVHIFDASDWSIKEMKEFLVKDNLGYGSWNYDELANQYSLEELEHYGMEDIDKYYVEEPDEKDDEVPEAPEEPKSKLGDLYELGEHRVLCGDSTKIEDVERLLENNIPDLIYTDPPYGINEKGDRSNRGGLTKGNKLPDFKDDTNQYAIDAYNLCESFKIPRQVWWGANYYCHSLPLSNNWFVWDKRVEEKQTNTQSDCELAWVKSKWSSIRIFRHLWKGMMKDSEKGERRVHATQKPIALAEWAFDYFKEVITVLDLFLGSGSTLIASEKTNRKCYGMELDPKYVDVIVQRYVDYTGNTKIKKNGKDIEWEKSDDF